MLTIPNPPPPSYVHVFFYMFSLHQEDGYMITSMIGFVIIYATNDYKLLLKYYIYNIIYVVIYYIRYL